MLRVETARSPWAGLEQVGIPAINSSLYRYKLEIFLAAVLIANILDKCIDLALAADYQAD